MITEIELKNIATYSNKQTLSNLREVNYIYGSNGSGKTTISRVLGQLEKYPDCSIKWENNAPLKILVYNIDFVKEHFTANEDMKGVFTLGTENSEILEQIGKKNKIIEKISIDIETNRKTLYGEDGKSGKTGELNNLNAEYTQTFWEIMKPYKDKFKKCLEGYLGDSKKYKVKLLEESRLNKEDCITEEKLNKTYQEVYAEDIAKDEIIEPIPFTQILEIEESTVLSKRIIGKEDVDIAALITKLDNSSWVHEGMKYYHKSGGVCPFCQQTIQEKFSQSLQEYFDETYLNDMQLLHDVYDSYKRKRDEIIAQLKQISENKKKYFENTTLPEMIELIEKTTQNNIHIIEDKIKDPTQSMKLESLQDIINKIENIINQANDEIRKHNERVENHETVQKTLKKQVWKFLITKSQNKIKEFINEEQNIQKAITSLKTQISQNEDLFRDENIQRQRLERQITSVQPTCNEINAILRIYGFTNFSLKVVNDNSYILVRADGSEVKDTLSEGEKNFVTFLYFYHLIRGSLNASDINEKKVIVFDDPISSLDNEILFIVSSLIRDIIIDKENVYPNVTQVFILTHNIYFHKEVSFVKNQKNDNRLKTKTFWIITKRDNQSIITKYDKNPIKTSYQALWENIKDEKINPVSIPNDMRRILENYFTTLGGVPVDNLEDEFEGQEKYICRSLCSWLHDNSHTCFGDEFYTPLDDNQIVKYKEVFKKIFEKYHHEAHYKMMMGIKEE